MAAIVHNLPLCSGLLETGLTTGHPTPIFSVGEVCFEIVDLAMAGLLATIYMCGHCPFSSCMIGWHRAPHCICTAECTVKW